jgi:histidyl-tRNA synthetase
MKPEPTPEQLTRFEVVFIDCDFEEVILPSLWEQQTFIDKAGPEIVNQMWAFQDKGGRDVCLIPEVTGLVQELWRDEWSKTNKTRRIFYVNRCYRYERPQSGRYREFTQFGVELLGGDKQSDRREVIDALVSCLSKFPQLQYQLNETVKRGLSYYVEDGFEVECECLGAQKQIAGGGRYAEGIGWAIGVDRLILANTKR